MKQTPRNRICQHKRGSFQCSEITSADALSFANGFYSSTSKLLQDCYLLKYCLGSVPKDRQIGLHKQSVRISYSIRRATGEVVAVCKKAFYSILNISEFRVNRVVKNHLENGSIPKENRGGDRKRIKFMNRRSAVIAYIQTFQLIDMHYCRSKIKHRQYLPQELNITKMANMYNDQAEGNLLVKVSYFRSIFNTNFNIGFKSPATDLCSICIMLSEQIKHSKNEKNKKQLVKKKNIHKLRAKAFFKLLKVTRPRTKKFSFDCQKNQVLPKVEDQAAYRSRQLYQNNFGIVEGSSKDNLTIDNVFLYEWTENIRPKGANEIASGVYHRLKNSNYRGYSKVELFADGCGGQNKNSIMVGMCAYWLQKESPKHVKEIELIFPVVGHSYMPPDRVFALIEKDIKKRQEVIDPRDYVNIFKKFGTVISLGSTECPVFDWKTEIKAHLKPPGQLHFKFNPCKRFILRKRGGDQIVLRGENFYRKDLGFFQGFCKRGSSISNMNPKVLESEVEIPTAKLKDVDNLLGKHFGKQWKEMGLESLEFYTNLIPNFEKSKKQIEQADMESETETDESLSESEDFEDYI